MNLDLMLPRRVPAPAPARRAPAPAPVRLPLTPAAAAAQASDLAALRREIAAYKTSRVPPEPHPSDHVGPYTSSRTHAAAIETMRANPGWTYEAAVIAVTRVR